MWCYGYGIFINQEQYITNCCCLIKLSKGEKDVLAVKMIEQSVG